MKIWHLATICAMPSIVMQVQERLTKEIALAVDDAICPNGVAVVVEASHMCMVGIILINLIIISIN